jgi:hypothetical protein
MTTWKPTTEISVIIVDIDGTIALKGNRDPYDLTSVSQDKPNATIIELTKHLNDYTNCQLVFVSGRNEVCRTETTEWLEKHGFMYPILFMRKSNDFRADEIVKKEIYETEIFPARPWFVLDDRNRTVKMWRELGLTCLQVAEGDF